MRLRFTLRALVWVAVIVFSDAGLAFTLGERATLQASMQNHIQHELVNGKYLHLDPRSGTVRALRPHAAHPIILRMGEYFILCSDFRTPDGESVNIDFYLAPKGSGYVVFNEQVENRTLVHRLVKSGQARRLD